MSEWRIYSLVRQIVTLDTFNESSLIYLLYSLEWGFLYNLLRLIRDLFRCCWSMGRLVGGCWSTPIPESVEYKLSLPRQDYDHGGRTMIVSHYDYGGRTMIVGQRMTENDWGGQSLPTCLPENAENAWGQSLPTRVIIERTHKQGPLLALWSSWLVSCPVSCLLPWMRGDIYELTMQPWQWAMLRSGIESMSGTFMAFLMYLVTSRDWGGEGARDTYMGSSNVYFGICCGPI
jgi:hypothetical protein